MIRGLKHITYKEKLRIQDLSTFKKRRLSGDPVARYKQNGARLFLENNGQQIHLGI